MKATITKEGLIKILNYCLIYGYYTDLQDSSIGSKFIILPHTYTDIHEVLTISNNIVINPNERTILFDSFRIEVSEKEITELTDLFDRVKYQEKQTIDSDTKNFYNYLLNKTIS